MRASIEKHLLKHWYGTRSPPWYLRILEPVYAAVYQRVQKKQTSDTDSYRPVLPVIVVGNLTAGGSGKTPLVIGLCQLAVEMKLKAGIASTGYGRRSRDTVVVKEDGDTDLCGDEPVLLAKRCNAEVVVAERRIDAVKKLHEMGVDLIISDDGLQQTDLYRDIDICVVDGARGVGNGHLLPAGPLREPAERLSEVDCVVSNGEWPGMPDHLNVITMNLEATEIHRLDNHKSYSLDEFRKKHVDTPMHAVAAIGNPERFFNTLAQHRIDVIPHRFADHHRFKKQDFESMSAATAIIMTEKDAVKCRGFGLENAWYVPVDTCLPEKFKHWFKHEVSMLTKDKT